MDGASFKAPRRKSKPEEEENKNTKLEETQCGINVKNKEK
jgi:hypothetical protein